MAGSDDITTAVLLRAGELEPLRSLEHPLMRAADAVRPSSRPGLGESVFCCRSLLEALMWMGWARRTHSPDGVTVQALAVRPARLWCYPAALWEQLHEAGPADESSLRRYWASGIRWSELEGRPPTGGVWEDAAGVEVLAPVCDIMARHPVLFAQPSPTG